VRLTMDVVGVAAGSLWRCEGRERRAL